MKIKKLTAAAMTGMMILGMGTNVCAASTQTMNGVGESNPQDVRATYAATDSGETVYSVDITWGSMEYTYTVANDGTWDPTTHEFTQVPNGQWSCSGSGDNAGQVKVTNHSNAAVNAAFGYTKKQGFDSVTGTFSSTMAKLDTAVGTTLENAPTATSTLDLSGELKHGVTDTTVGTATVTLSEVTD